MKKIFVVASMATLALSPLANAEKLVLKGSDTLGAKLVPQLAEAFKAKNPNVTFQIAAEGSSTGIAALTDGATDIAMSSRRVKAKEMSAAAAKGVKMTPTIAAFDGIAVIVNQSNKLDGLTLEQVERIFTGDVSDWSAVGGKSGTISVYTRNTASGTYADFKELAMSKRDYAASSQKMAGNEQIALEVGKNANGIGYVGLAYTKASGIKVLAIDGVKPSDATVRSKSYKIGRPTFYYTNGAPSGLAKQFIDFALSPAGAKIVKTVGFVPVQ